MNSFKSVTHLLLGTLFVVELHVTYKANCA